MQCFCSKIIWNFQPQTVTRASPGGLASHRRSSWGSSRWRHQVIQLGEGWKRLSMIVDVLQIDRSEPTSGVCFSLFRGRVQWMESCNGHFAVEGKNHHSSKVNHGIPTGLIEVKMWGSDCQVAHNHGHDQAAPPWSAIISNHQGSTSGPLGPIGTHYEHSMNGFNLGWKPQ